MVELNASPIIEIDGEEKGAAPVVKLLRNMVIAPATAKGAASASAPIDLTAFCF